MARVVVVGAGVDPGVSKALEDTGGLRLNFVRDVLPAQVSGGWQDGDERYEWLTGRRVLVEAAGIRLARCPAVRAHP
jgi:hypothetical protein